MDQITVNHDVYNSSQVSENEVSNTGACVNKVSKITALCSRSLGDQNSTTFHQTSTEGKVGENQGDNQEMN
ncbi:unnamed protein product, partial [Porites evermanni]